MRIVGGLVLAGAVGVARRSGCFEVAMFDAWEDVAVKSGSPASPVKVVDDSSAIDCGCAAVLASPHYSPPDEIDPDLELEEDEVSPPRFTNLRDSLRVQKETDAGRRNFFSF